MAILYPTTLDSFTNPSPTTTRTAVSLSGQMTDKNNAIVALETKIGTGSSTPIANTVLRGTGTGTSAFQTIALATDISGTLPVANGGTGVTTSTGTVAVVLSTSPTLVTPVLGVASATSINKVTLTAPATSATLTIADGKTLTASNTITLAGVDATTLTFQGTDTYVGRTTTDTLTNKTLTNPTINGHTDTAQTYTPSAAGTATLDLSLADEHRITMPAGNITVALSNAVNGKKFIVSLTQDATGSRTVTWFTTIKWQNGNTTPVLTTTASKRDTFGFICTGTNTYDGFIIGQNI